MKLVTNGGMVHPVHQHHPPKKTTNQEERDRHGLERPFYWTCGAHAGRDYTTQPMCTPCGVPGQTSIYQAAPTRPRERGRQAGGVLLDVKGSVSDTSPAQTTCGHGGDHVVEQPDTEAHVPGHCNRGGLQSSFFVSFSGFGSVGRLLLWVADFLGSHILRHLLTVQQWARPRRRGPPAEAALLDGRRARGDRAPPCPMGGPAPDNTGVPPGTEAHGPGRSDGDPLHGPFYWTAGDPRWKEGPITHGWTRRRPRGCAARHRGAWARSKRRGPAEHAVLLGGRGSRSTG